MNRTVLAVLIFAVLCIPPSATAAKCVTGTVGSFLGTTCTIGNVAFTFGTFSGFSETVDLNNNINQYPIDPNSLTLVPVVNGTLQGFQILSPGFTDNPSANGWEDSSHDAWFTYGVTALNGALISGESEGIVGSIGNASDTGAISGADFQNYDVAPWCCQTTVWGNINYTNGLGYYYDPYTVVHFADFGASAQPGSDLTNLGMSTINDFAYTTQIATLTSSLVLYDTAPVPEPTSLLLFGSGAIGLAGVISRKLKR